MAHQLRRNDYTVGWVCALPIELAAAQEMLDEEHPDLERNADDNDENLYALGSIGGHNVVIVCLPAGRIGNNPAAVVATQMRATFKSLRFGLMVGIGGGVPSAEADIRLGDVVVSQPAKIFGGVVQYDSGKATPSGFERTGSLNAPPQMLLAALARVWANEMRGRSRTPDHVAKLGRIPKFKRSKAGPDVLFQAAYDHVRGPTCEACSADRQESRQPRDMDEEVVTHYGTIASGNQVIKSAADRDRISQELGGVLCFEMEAAGLMNSFPCLVIRGICDYADSHKNKQWQPYAAGTAAAYAKELLLVIPPVEVTKSVTAEEAMQTASRRAIYCIPFLKNHAFVGRQPELDTLKQKLMVDRTCRKMTILGLGGTGKTQVALQFAYTVKETWPECSIFWLPAVSMESFKQACSEILKALNVQEAADEDVKELVKLHLSAAHSGRWLLVVDNADDHGIVMGNRQSKGIVDYLPQSEAGVVLFTTRARDVAVSLTGAHVLKLGAMEPQEAMLFLEASLAKDVVRDAATTQELLDELAYLPLAIVQAAAFLNFNEISVARYLQLLRSAEQYLVELMSVEYRDETRYDGSRNAIATTWVVSFNQIRERDGVAADLLLFLSCIEWKAIPRSILPSEHSEVRMDKAIGTLLGYSFLARRGEEDWYDMHRLVHMATRVWVTQQGDITMVTAKAIRHMADIFPYGFNYENRLLWRGYLPHAVCLFKGRHDSALDGEITLCLQVGRCFILDGRFKEAVSWLEEASEQKEALKRDDMGRPRLQWQLAYAYLYNGQVKKAIELREDLVAIESVLAEDHPERLVSRRQLAEAYLQNDQVKEAVKLLENIVAIQSVLAEDHIQRLASEHALSKAYLSNSQVKEAIQLLESVVAIKAKKLAEDHPDRLASEHALSKAYLSNSQVKEAIQLLENVVAISAKVVAEDHPNRLASEHTLGIAYLFHNQVKDAVQLLESVLAVALEAKELAKDDPDRLALGLALGVAYFLDNQVEEATQLLESVLAKDTEAPRLSHQSRVYLKEVLKRCYTGEAGEATDTGDTRQAKEESSPRVIAEDLQVTLQPGKDAIAGSISEGLSFLLSPFRQ